uniref:Uncharacterized protein n=1 Tax=Syphacia muris TaxID=451379 RepID=A0A0N5AWG1_9BILA
MIKIDDNSDDEEEIMVKDERNEERERIEDSAADSGVVAAADAENNIRSNLFATTIELEKRPRGGRGGRRSKEAKDKDDEHSTQLNETGAYRLKALLQIQHFFARSSPTNRSQNLLLSSVPL